MNKEKELILLLEKIERIVASNADWEFIYDRAFNIFGNEISPLIDELGLSFDYYDPDTSYEEDVMALTNALKDIKRNLVKIVYAETGQR